MTIEGGFGAKFKIKVSSSLTAIVHAKDITIPEFEKVLADITAHDSPGGYQQFLDTGKRKLSEIKLKITWDISEATHAAVQAAFAATTAVDMSVEDPGGTEVIAFKAFVHKLGRIVAQEKDYECDVAIQPTGVPTINGS